MPHSAALDAALALAALAVRSFSPFSRAFCVSVRGRAVLAEWWPEDTMALNSPLANSLMACYLFFKHAQPSIHRKDCFLEIM